MYTTMEGREYLCFIDSSREAGTYALDELFTEPEVLCLQRRLGTLHRAVRIERISRIPAVEQQASWNLVGVLFELPPPAGDRLPFRVFGCLYSGADACSPPSR